MCPDLAKVEAILGRYPRDESSLVMVLQDIQEEFRYLPGEALQRVATILDIPRARVFSVSTFYRVFSREPQGRVLVQVCKGTTCHVRGGEQIEREICRELGAAVGSTTPDGQFTIRTVNCVGACAMAPVVVAGDRYHGEVRASRVHRILRDAARAREAADAGTPARRVPDVPNLSSPGDLFAFHARATAVAAETARVRVCGGPGCLAAGSRAVRDAIEDAAAAENLPLRTDFGGGPHRPGERLLELTGCQGLCQQGPLVHLAPEDLLYTRVRPRDASEILRGLAAGRAVERLLGETCGRAGHPFYAGQLPLALSTCGAVDPDSLEEYVASGGFLALAGALARGSPAGVLAAVEASGLRGRGGAGFPTGRKWRSALHAAADSGHAPYVLCNGDEGDPGAFMDRAIMEGSPFQVLEGMLLGAYAVGAREGWLYVRAEYPLAVQRLEHAVATCRQAGLLGERILGGPLSLDLRISRGGGAFVCGESTALMRSIEGKAGEPRAKYTRSVERGLYDRPTVLNNVETWALIPGIVRHGPQWLSSHGTARSKGTKAFSLSGQVRRTGLVEVPMGTTLRELIFGVGGGMRDGRRFKAVQTGGPSGGCLPESMLDRPIDFEELVAAGSMMGSGGMIVMDERTCMVDVARYFVDFLLEESCGKCGPCRLGLSQLSYLLGRVTRGEARAADFGRIEEIGAGMMTNSLCGLGKSAPNPVLSTLRYFRKEYEEHLQGRCPAGVCRALIRYEISADCPGCLRCIEACPNGAITGEVKVQHVIDPAKCDKCGICQAICDKYDAVRIVSGEGPWTTA
ncbi:MAG: NAD(P)H-dependent oxidoreductase subunit E [Planctomycetota bacterium]